MSTQNGFRGSALRTTDSGLFPDTWNLIPDSNFPPPLFS